jgi:hypothetical protein
MITFFVHSPQSRGKVEKNKNHNPGSAFTQAVVSKESK